MTTGTRQRARKQPAEVRREEIVEAAMRVFAHTSFRAAGTAQIARAAGIAEPTIYRHFDSKRELYLAVVARSSDIISEHFRRIDAATPDALEALHQMGEWYEQNICDNPEYLKLRQRAVAEAEEEEVRTLLRDGYLEIIGIVAGVIRRGQAQGIYAPSINPESAAWLFCAMGQLFDLFQMIGMNEQAMAACGEGSIAMFKSALGAPIVDRHHPGQGSTGGREDHAEGALRARAQ